VAFLDECIEFTGEVWDRYIHHPWIEAMFRCELTDERFTYWLAQDLSYVADPISIIGVPKCPPHNPWGRLQTEYAATAKQTRVERKLAEQLGNFALSRWAARPRREAFVNFAVRAAYEGTFGEICCANYPCYCFCDTFGKRYLRDTPRDLPPNQVEWIQQFNEPLYDQIARATEDGINEYGAAGTDFERTKMRWVFLRATQHQIATFDAAWEMSDQWAGEDEETAGDVLALHAGSLTGTPA
jgi:thiaminase/transcriptional activator TenA